MGCGGAGGEGRVCTPHGGLRPWLLEKGLDVAWSSNAIETIIRYASRCLSISESTAAKCVCGKIGEILKFVSIMADDLRPREPEMYVRVTPIMSSLRTTLDQSRCTCLGRMLPYPLQFNRNHPLMTAGMIG